MNPDSTPHHRDELEARVTALLLGELSPEEAAALRQTIVQDAALAQLHDRLQLTLDLVRETAATPAGELSEPPAPLKLSAARREALLAHFKTVAPPELARPRANRISWAVPLAAAAAIALLATVLVLPKFRAEYQLADSDSFVVISGRAIRSPESVSAASADLAVPAQPTSPARLEQRAREHDLAESKINGAALHQPTEATKKPSVASPGAYLPAFNAGSDEVAFNPNATPTAGPAEKDLQLNFRDVPVDTTLNYLSSAEGFNIIRDADTRTAGTVDLVSDLPINKEETVSLLNKSLAKQDLTAVRDGKTLTVMTLEEAKANPGTPATVWHSGAVNTTGGGADIRDLKDRIAELDTKDHGDLQRFRITNADTKAVASELNELFMTHGNNSGREGNSSGLFGRRGGGGFGSGISTNSPSIKVNAVADDQDNAVTVRAPRAIMDNVSNIIGQLDTAKGANEAALEQAPNGQPVQVTFGIGSVNNSIIYNSDEANNAAVVESLKRLDRAASHTDLAGIVGSTAVPPSREQEKSKLSRPALTPIGQAEFALDQTPGQKPASAQSIINNGTLSGLTSFTNSFNGGGGRRAIPGADISASLNQAQPQGSQPTSAANGSLGGDDGGIYSVSTVGYINVTVSNGILDAPPAETTPVPNNTTFAARFYASDVVSNGFGGGGGGGGIANGPATPQPFNSSQTRALTQRANPAAAFGGVLSTTPLNGPRAGIGGGIGAGIGGGLAGAGQGPQLLSMDKEWLPQQSPTVTTTPPQAERQVTGLAEDAGKRQAGEVLQQRVDRFGEAEAGAEPKATPSTDGLVISGVPAPAPVRGIAAGTASPVQSLGDVPLLGTLFNRKADAAAVIASPPPARNRGASQADVAAIDPAVLARLEARRPLDISANIPDRPAAPTASPVASQRPDLLFKNSAQKADAAPARPAVPALVPQPEVLTRENAFSTFSLNVSDVSFKLAAASLQNGALPEAGTVRSEEFINAFDYRDSEPAPGAPIGFAWERADYPFAHNRDLLRFAVKTAAEGRQAGRPLNLVLLLDKSGSMERADRVAIIREALRVLAGQLQAQDRFSVVVFARTARLWADGVPGNQAGEVAKALEGLTPEGGTNLEEAMKLAYETALRHYLANGENRVVVLTDGAANLGDVTPGTLQKKVEANRAQGIALDCFGVGWEDYNDNLLEVLSRAGGGRYGFINTPEEAAAGFAGQLAGALRVAASDVKVQVEFNPSRVISYRQIGYAKDQLTKQQFRDNTVKAAQIGAAESGNALYTVELNPAGDGPVCTVRMRYRTPGTSDYSEHAWDVPYTGAAAPLDQASPAMRLAATASAFSEWLAGSPYAGEVTLDQLLGYVRGVPEFYGADARPKQLETMLREAKSISGK